MFGASLGGGAMESVMTAVSLVGAGEYVGSLNRMSRAWGDVETAQSRAARMGQNLENLGVGLTAGLTGTLIAGVGLAAKFAGEVESVQAGIETMLGSADAAARKMAELRNFAKASPFNFSEVAKGAQLLLAFGVRAEDLLPTLKAVGNGIAAMGGGNEQFTGALRAIGQISTKGKVSAEELNQLAEHGIPAYEILRKKLGLTAEEMQRIGEKGIGASVALKAIREGLTEGRYTGALEKQAGTLKGQLSNLRDEAESTFADLGMAAMPIFKEGLELIRGFTPAIKDAVSWFSKLDDTTKKWVVGIGGGIGPLTLLSGKVIGIMAAMKTAKATSALQKAAGAAGGITGTSTAMMTVNAGVVNVNGGAAGGLGGAASGAGAGGAAGAAGGLGGFLQRAVGPQFSVGNGALRGATMGSAIGGAVVGVAAGAGVRDDMKTLGYGEGAASGTALATGLSAAALTAFNPAAGVLLAAGVALRTGVNEFYNRPREREAEAGTGADNAERYGKDAQSNLKKAQDEVSKGGDRRKLADQYTELSTKAGMAGDDTTAKSYALNAMTQRRIAKKESDSSTPEFWAAQRKRSETWLKENPMQSGPVEGGDKGIISNDDAAHRRTNYSKFLRSQTSEGKLSVGQARTMQTDFDAQNAPKGKGAARPDAWTPETRALAEMFGVGGGKGAGQGEGGAAGDSGSPTSEYEMGAEKMDGSNSLTITVNIPPRKADADYRATKAANNTPMPVNP